MKHMILAVLLAIFAIGCSTSKAAEADATEPTETTTEATTDGAEPAGESTDATEPAGTAETAPEDVLPNDGSRQVGDVTKCPISGDVFTVTAESPKAEYEGGTYYVCCNGCVDKFNEDPAKFAAAGTEGGSVEDHHGHGHDHDGHTH